jgi:hypothetical protein
MRSQNSSRNAPLGPAVSTNENLDWLGAGTETFLHSASDASAQHAVLRQIAAGSWHARGVPGIGPERGTESR